MFYILHIHMNKLTILFFFFGFNQFIIFYTYEINTCITQTVLLVHIETHTSFILFGGQ